MRLVGVLRGTDVWIGVRVDGGTAFVAPLADFYRDPVAGLAQAASRSQRDADGLPPAVPVPLSAKVLCAGLNYADHTAESGKESPVAPDVFARWASTLSPDGAGVPVPRGEPGLDWEGELAAVIGRRLRQATPAEVEDAVLGYTVLNDLSARLHQRATSQWGIGKNADGSAPIGPVLVTPDEIQDPYALRIRTKVDGQTMQDGTTADMIFRVGRIGSYASEVMTLEPGDVISTGTPKGIGSTRRPPVFLRPGQTVEVEIEGIGVLRTPVVSRAVPIGAQPEELEPAR